LFDTSGFWAGAEIYEEAIYWAERTWTEDIGSPNGVDTGSNYVYANISNFGSGFGGMGFGDEGPTGSSVPEFSDIAWVLAAVLGAGGFYLIRRKKSF
jgi:hypothetical protein